MNPLRIALITVLTGLVVGLAGGVGYSYLTRESPVATVPEESGVMEVFCTGGQTPKVLVVWPQHVTAAIKSLERREESESAWTNIFAPGTKVNPEGYEDVNVVLGKTYLYRLTTNIGGAPEVDEVRVSELACTYKTP